MSHEQHPDPLWPRVRRETLALASLGGPLMANNLALAGMNLSDTIMAGRLGATDLAAVAVGHSVWMLAFLFGLGTLMAVIPIIAHCFGGSEPQRVGQYVRQGLWLSQALAALLFVALLGTESLVAALGVDPAIVPLTGGYVGAIAFGLPGIYAYLTLRFASEGIGHTRPVMFAAFVGLLVNLAGNYVLMFGKLGFPRLGAVGCGAASAIAMWSMFALMLVYVKRNRVYRPFAFFARFERPRLELQRELLALGGPIGLSVLSEIGLFSGIGLLMGTIGAVVVAAHQIALNVAATVFMLPLALHSALTVRVGQAMGQGQGAAARFSGLVGIGLCAGIVVITASLTFYFRGQLASLYTTDQAVRATALGLLTMAAVLQISDALQVAGAGALRGLKDTRVPMVINFFAYWVIGFPLAYALGIVAGFGPQAVWVGPIAGLTVAAAMLIGRFLLKSRRLADAGERSGSARGNVR